jgi:hypothetical protein
MALYTLPPEALMMVARYTPHPCAEIMQDFYEDEKYFEWLERWEMQRFNLRMHAGELSYDRTNRKRLRDPIEELAKERRDSLKYLGIYEDQIEYEFKRRR